MNPAKITTDEFRLRLAPGRYRAVTEAAVYLSRRVYDNGRFDANYRVYQPGEEHTEIEHDHCR